MCVSTLFALCTDVNIQANKEEQAPEWDTDKVNSLPPTIPPGLPSFLPSLLPSCQDGILPASVIFTETPIRSPSPSVHTPYAEFTKGMKIPCQYTHHMQNSRMGSVPWLRYPQADQRHNRDQEKKEREREKWKRTDWWKNFFRESLSWKSLLLLLGKEWMRVTLSNPSLEGHTESSEFVHMGEIKTWCYSYDQQS